MYRDVTGIILAGGRSIRMGENKAFLKIGNLTAIERVRNFMQSLFTNVILITNSPAEYSFLGLDTYEDVYKNMGPLAGIHSGLLNSTAEKNFILSCDLLLMKKEIVDYIINYETSKPITVSKAEGFVQTLAAVYQKRCIDFVEKILSENQKSENPKKKENNLLILIEKAGAEIISIENHSGYNKNVFFNMNNKSDYKEILKILN
ncbi:MAG: molybdenum cofactor guanylyltransferase [Bacteroidota bacterium]|nr:molybdenum cofactor guanylyltransferase [Bacteroidota bacterium]